MGRIGRSYPRFQSQQPESHSEPAGGRSGLHVAGAVVGLLAALALIGFLLTR